MLLDSKPLILDLILESIAAELYEIDIKYSRYPNDFWTFSVLFLGQFLGLLHLHHEILLLRRVLLKTASDVMSLRTQQRETGASHPSLSIQDLKLNPVI